MKPTLRSSLAVAALLSAASAASAATTTYYDDPAAGVPTTVSAPAINVYDLSPLTVSTSPDSIGSSLSVADANPTGASETFVSDFVFDVASLDSVGASANFTFTPQVGVTSYTLSIYSGSPTGPNTLVPTTVVSGVGQPSYDATLAAGDYFVQTDVVVGAHTSGKSDIQVVASAISAAPEPASWALVILSVAMIGGQLRSRRRAGAPLNLA